MKISMMVLLLLGAHLNLTALVPLKPGDTPPPVWVGGQLAWPFAVETRTLLSGDALHTSTPLLAITSATLLAMAAAALMRRVVPETWFPWLIIAGAACSIALQMIWFSRWAILPLLVDAALLWAVLGKHLTVNSFR